MIQHLYWEVREFDIAIWAKAFVLVLDRGCSCTSLPSVCHDEQPSNTPVHGFNVWGFQRVWLCRLVHVRTYGSCKTADRVSTQGINTPQGLFLQPRHLAGAETARIPPLLTFSRNLKLPRA